MRKILILFVAMLSLNASAQTIELVSLKTEYAEGFMKLYKLKSLSGDSLGVAYSLESNECAIHLKSPAPFPANAGIQSEPLHFSSLTAKDAIPVCKVLNRNKILYSDTTAIDYWEFIVEKRWKKVFYEKSIKDGEGTDWLIIMISKPMTFDEALEVVKGLSRDKVYMDVDKDEFRLITTMSAAVFDGEIAVIAKNWFPQVGVTLQSLQ